MNQQVAVKLAPGWCYAKVSEICEAYNGKVFKTEEWASSGLPIIRIQNLNNPRAHFNYYKGYVSEKNLVKNGDLLFAWSGTPGTSFGAHIWAGENAALNQHIFKIDFNNKNLNKKYFRHALQQNVTRYVEQAQGGVGLAHITKKKFDASLIPLPPLNEQDRIVAKIEELFSELDNGIESLKTAQAQLKVYRQALLKYAFEGKLTAQWRVNNPEKLETADALFKHIQLERTQRYQRELTKWNASEKQGSKPKVPKALPALTVDELAGLPVLPAGWEWIRLGNTNTDIFDGPFGSNLKSSDYVSSGVRVIRLENIGILEFLANKESYITETKYELLKGHTVSSGDIIFSSFITENVRVALLPKEVTKAVNKADCFCVRPFGGSLNIKYLVMFLSTRHVYKQLEAQIHGVGRPRINTTQLKDIFVPICGPDEQLAAIDELESRLSETEQLEQTITAALLRAGALRQSILKKAFSGKLVSQDPIDEPAPALLARIKAEKSAQFQSKKARI